MIDVIYIGAIFCAVITAFILIFLETPYQTKSNLLLAFFLLSCSYCMTLYLFIVSGWIKYIPQLYKTAAPINYLIPPLAYLYVKSVLLNEVKLYKKDILHFVVFLIFIINYIPFYLLPYSEKYLIVKQIIGEKGTSSYLSKSGILPENISFIVREVQVFVYLFIQWRLIISFKNNKFSENLKLHTKTVYRWLNIFTWSITVDMFSFIVFSITSIITKNSEIIIYQNISQIIFAIGFFVLCSYLLYNPKVLYGFPYIGEQNKKNRVVNDTEKKTINPLSLECGYEGVAYTIKNYFENEQPFLAPGLTITDVSSALNLPVRDISFILNNYYKQRFTDFVNSHRIDYVKRQISGGYLTDYTIEALAKQAGFSSIRTFNRVFQKMHQTTPTSYISGFKEN